MNSSFRLLVASCLTSLLAATSAAAQSPAPVTTGARVRVTLSKSFDVRQVGKVVWANADSAMVEFLEPATGPSVSSMTPIKPGERRFLRIADFEVSSGVRSREWLGAIGGAVLGGGLGYAIGMSGGEECSPGSVCIIDGKKLSRSFGTVGAIAGAIAGGYAGKRQRSETWLPVAATPTTRLSVSPGLHGRGASLRLSVRYQALR